MVALLGLTGCGDALVGVRADAGHLPIPDERPETVTDGYVVVDVTGSHSVVVADQQEQVEVLLVGVGDVEPAAPEEEPRVPGARDDDEDDKAEQDRRVAELTECMSAAAVVELASLVDGESVYLEFEETEGGGETTGEGAAEDGVEPRPQVYLWVGDDLVNTELLEAGVLTVKAGDPVPFSRQSAFRKVAGAAQKEQVGLYEPGACGQPVEDPDA